MNKNIVYSTDPDWRPERKSEKDAAPLPQQQTAYLRLERKGRGGKVVTVVAELKGDIKKLQKALQKHCGTGGTVKQGQIELQGDHRNKAADYLRKQGYNTKMSGG